MLSFLDTCDNCCNTTLTKEYQRFLKDHLLSLLKELSNKSTEWCSFKTETLLESYLNRRGYYFEKYFRPIELYNALDTCIENEFMLEPGNDDIILLNKELEICFDTNVIIKSELQSLISTYVNNIISLQVIPLQNNYIHSNLVITTPLNIIYNDGSSRFWLHPTINRLLNKKKIIYSWSELVKLFELDICNNKTHVRKLNSSLFSINPLSPLTKLFAFKYFHKNQIETILKQITTFLGRSNSLLTICPNLKFPLLSKHDKVIVFIEQHINNSDRLLNIFNNSIYI